MGNELGKNIQKMRWNNHESEVNICHHTFVVAKMLA